MEINDLYRNDKNKKFFKKIFFIKLYKYLFLVFLSFYFLRKIVNFNCSVIFFLKGNNKKDINIDFEFIVLFFVNVEYLL